MMFNGDIAVFEPDLLCSLITTRWQIQLKSPKQSLHQRHFR